MDKITQLETREATLQELMDFINNQTAYCSPENKTWMIAIKLFKHGYVKEKTEEALKAADGKGVK